MRGMIIKVLASEEDKVQQSQIQSKIFKGGLYFCNYREANNLLKLQQLKIGAIVAVMKTDYNEYKPYKYFKLKGKLVEQGYMISQERQIQDYRNFAQQEEGIKKQLTNVDAQQEYIKSQEVLKQIPIEDLDNSDLSRYFFETAKWIESKRNEGKNVLVHCMKGNSRSPAIILSYLMISNKEKIEKNGKVIIKNWSYEKAHDFLKNITKEFNPNQGFVSQLQELERFLDIDFTYQDNVQSGLDLSIMQTSILKNQINQIINIYQINYSHLYLV